MFDTPPASHDIKGRAAALALIDDKEKIIAVDPAWEKLTGQDATTLVGTALSDFFDQGTSETVLEAFDTAVPANAGSLCLRKLQTADRRGSSVLFGLLSVDTSFLLIAVPAEKPRISRVSPADEDTIDEHIAHAGKIDTDRATAGDNDVIAKKQIVNWIAARRTARNVRLHSGIDPLTRALKSWAVVETNCLSVSRAYEDFGKTPMNMQIQAGHLKDSGIPLGVIAMNFAAIGSQINEELNIFSKVVECVGTDLHQAYLAICLFALTEEVSHALAPETPDEISVALRTCAPHYHQKSVAAHAKIAVQAKGSVNSAGLIQRYLAGLSMTRVMCAIENAQLDAGGNDSITAIIAELRQFQESADQNMRTISDELSRFNRVISTLPRSLAS